MATRISGPNRFDSYLTLDEVASYLRVRRGTIYSWVKSGKMPGWKVVGQWRFSRREIDRWVRNQPNIHPRSKR